MFYEPFVKLDIRRFNEDLQRLIGVLIDYGYREAEEIRAKMNTSLWNDLEELFLYYSWTEGGLPSTGAVRDGLLSSMKEGYIAERIIQIYNYILENKHLVSPEFDPRSIIELQLFFDSNFSKAP